MKKAIIVSAKYSPGHFSHMLAYYQMFKSIGILPLLYVDKEYSAFLSTYPEYHKRYISNKNTFEADIILVYNMSIKDSSMINSFKRKNPNLKVIFVYHEPWYGFKGWFSDLKKRNETLKESCKAIVRYIVARCELKRSDKILLPSHKALENYEKYCRKHNPNYILFPLIFTDECTTETNNLKRKYFSFISTASNSKNFGRFIEFVKYRSKVDHQTKFQIVTRTDISSCIDEDIKKLEQQGRLIIKHGRDLTNEEINRAYATSNCTWMLYSRSTQSGALCKSFMFGAPVIASDIGSFKEIIDGTNGIIIPTESSIEVINQKYDAILSEIEKYSNGARRTFNERFYYANKIDSFKEIMQHDFRNP